MHITWGRSVLKNDFVEAIEWFRVSFPGISRIWRFTVWSLLLSISSNSSNSGVWGFVFHESAFKTLSKVTNKRYHSHCLPHSVKQWVKLLVVMTKIMLLILPNKWTSWACLQSLAFHLVQGDSSIDFFLYNVNNNIDDDTPLVLAISLK